MAKHSVMIKKVLLASLLFAAPFLVSAQEEEEEDKSKMVREVIEVMVERAKFAPPPPPPVADTKGKKGKKKKETPPPEVAPDTGNPMMPAPSGEVMKRAQHWAKSKSKYKKTQVNNTGNAISTQVIFPYKQKILNPENDVDGEIVMDVTVEAKEGKYRYTIKNIKHKAAKPGMSGGDIYLKVPECGSMKVTDQTWKQIKSAAYANIKTVSDDIKAKMGEEGGKKKDDW